MLKVKLLLVFGLCGEFGWIGWYLPVVWVWIRQKVLYRVLVNWRVAKGKGFRGG